jgi:TorA maturation chaperone TorD
VAKHQHTFVDTYDGMVGFGFSREVDEKSLMFYLQKISADDLVKALVPRLNDQEITQLFELLSQLMRKYLTDDEYHHLFLKDEHQEAPCD